MLQVKVTKSYRDNDQLVVEAQIVEIEGKSESVKQDRKFGYALDVDKKEVAAEMVKWLATYKSDLATGMAASELEEKNAKADDTIASLESLSVTDAKE